MKRNIIHMMLMMLVISTLAVSNGAAGNNGAENPDSAHYNYFYPESPSNYEVITTYGKLPELETEMQRENWTNSLNELEKELATEIYVRYIHPDGKILTYGDNSAGYFVIVFHKNIQADGGLMDEIYATISKNAEQNGIQEVPVEFGHGDAPQKSGDEDEPTFLNYAFHSNLDIGIAADISDDWDTSCGACHASETESVVRLANSYTPEVIATYGTLPEFENEEQRLDWANNVQMGIFKGLNHSISNTYFYPEGALIMFGTGYPEGYFEVTVLRNLTINESQMNEIYAIIDEEAQKHGILEVPVRFVFGDMPVLDEVSSESMPGVVLFDGLIAFSGMWLFRRRQIKEGN